jgi:NtrC-family two-component system sensor histidine kinase KinB
MTTRAATSARIPQESATARPMWLVPSMAAILHARTRFGSLPEPLCYTARTMTAPDEHSSVELLYSISREIAAPLDLRTVLTRLLLAALRNVGGERGTIVVFDEKGLPVDSAIVYGEEARESDTDQLRETVDHGLAGWVIRNRQGALVSDTRNDERWVHRPDDDAGQGTGKAAICVPLLARDKLVGVMTVVHPAPNSLGEDEFALVQTIADQAGVAVLNAFLYGRLQTAHQRYRELFENSLDPLFITDWQGRVLEANLRAATITGYPLEQLPGMSIGDIHDLHPERTGEGFTSLHSAVCTYESELHQAGGRTIPVEVQAHQVSFEEADLLQWMLRDITERRELDKLREELAGMIYHDLRSPLTNIVSSVEILGTMLPDDPATRQVADAVLDIARHSIDRLQRMTNSLLDIQRLEAGQQPGERVAVSPAALAEEARRAALPMTDTRGQTLLVELPASMPAVQVDEDMIRRVLINLLENASKFTPSGSEIRMGGRGDGAWATVWVEDNGPGISAEDSRRIFEKYTRITGGTPSGLGLGLAFCRLAVEAHGGHIWLDSQPGKGSRFSFTLPATAPA